MVKMIKNLVEQNETSNFFYLLVGLLALLSVLFVMSGDDEGLPFILGWIMGFIIIAMLAYNLIEWVGNRIEGTEDWTEERDLDEDINLRVRDISDLLKRASEGEKNCQEILHEKLKKMFFLKLEEKEDISDKDLRGLLKDQENFREVVQDEVIADFILSMEEELDEAKTGGSKILSSKKRKGGRRRESEKEYRAKIKEIIKRIDSWEERYYG